MRIIGSEGLYLCRPCQREVPQQRRRDSPPVQSCFPLLTLAFPLFLCVKRTSYPPVTPILLFTLL